MVFHLSHGFLLSRINLTEADKTLIVSGGWLTDMDINVAQAILKVQFTNLAGLEPTFLASYTSEN